LIHEELSEHYQDDFPDEFQDDLMLLAGHQKVLKNHGTIAEIKQEMLLINHYG
jgi:hypothetical protein